MTRTVWLLTLGFALHGCGADSDDSSLTVQPDSDYSQVFEVDDEAVETGSLAVDLPGEHGSSKAMCSINITRIVDERLANVILTLDVLGKGCDVFGSCDNPNMQSGEFSYSGGIDGDQPFATMILNYEPPSDSEEEILWMYNVLYNSAPFSRFEMWVDGEPFNALTSDSRGAEDFSKGPHLWNTKIEIEADMLQSTDAGDQSLPGLQTLGTFSYEGLCEVSAKYVQL